MRYFAILVAVVCLAFTPKFMLKSIQPLVYVTGVNSCTAFSVNQREGWWMTAGHCLREGQSFEGSPIEVLAADEKLDLGVITGSHRPAFQLAIKQAEVGEDVTIIGFPFGSRDPLAMFGKVSSPNAKINDEQSGAVQHVASGGGASGSPVLDSAGRVICVHQLGQAGFSACNAYDDFKGFAERFFER